MGTVHSSNQGEEVMKTFLPLLCALVVVSAVPQGRQDILRRILGSENNPCGAGVRPNCYCLSNNSQPSPGNPCPGGSGDTQCACPDGRTFTPDRNRIQNLIRGLRG